MYREAHFSFTFSLKCLATTSAWRRVKSAPNDYFPLLCTQQIDIDRTATASVASIALVWLIMQLSIALPYDERATKAKASHCAAGKSANDGIAVIVVPRVTVVCSVLWCGVVSRVSAEEKLM